MKGGIEMNNMCELILTVRCAAERYIKLRNDDESRSSFYDRDETFRLMMVRIRELEEEVTETVNIDEMFVNHFTFLEIMNSLNWTP